MKYQYIVFALLVVLVSIGIVQAATPAQCAVLKGAGFTGVCDSKTLVTKGDVNLGISKGVAGAKKFLTSRASNLRKSKAPVLCAGNKNIERLNNTFAVCSANFIKGYESVYGAGSVKVVSGFRSGSEQSDGCGNNAAAGGAPNSNHAKGLAIDVNPADKGSYKTLYNFAKQNPSFGVCFPHYGWDNPHMTLAGGGGGEARKCAAQGVSKPCSGAPKFDPRQQSYNQDIANYQPNGGGAPSGVGQEQKPQGGAQGGQPPQVPKPPSGGPGGAPAGDGKNPYSKAGKGTDPYGIWKDPATGETAVNAASITCDPGTIGGSERSLIAWKCGGESTRSRGATTRLQSRFNTKGRLTGKGYARPRADTSYKIQCVAGDKVVGEAVCKVRRGAAGGEQNTSGSDTRAVLHLSAAQQFVGWGGSTSLQWATIGASNCTLKGGSVKDGRESGSAETGKLYKPTIYALECDTSEGTKTVKAEVKIR